MKVQEALNDLVECARLLGQTQGKKVYGDYTQEDSRFTVAMYQSIEKHSSIIKSALSDIENCEPVGWMRKIGDRVERITLNKIQLTDTPLYAKKE
jgi:hypothetical protein